MRIPVEIPCFAILQNIVGHLFLTLWQKTSLEAMKTKCKKNAITNMLTLPPLGKITAQVCVRNPVAYEASNHGGSMAEIRRSQILFSLRQLSLSCCSVDPCSAPWPCSSITNWSAYCQLGFSILIVLFEIILSFSSSGTCVLNLKL